MVLHLRDYFAETTVHGFRYVVEGRTLLERAVWVGVIVAAFAVAGTMLASSLRDTSANPIATAADRVPVGDLYFPAVTVSPRPVFADDETWERISSTRFPLAVLNSLIFDCSLKDTADNCTEESSALRTDMDFLIQDVVNIRYLKNQMETEMYTVPGTEQKVFGHLFCNDLAYGESATMQALLDVGGVIEEASSDEVVELAKSTLRVPDADARSELYRFYSARKDAAPDQRVLHLDCETSQDTFSLRARSMLAGLVAAQGDKFRPLHFGDFVREKFLDRFANGWYDEWDAADLTGTQTRLLKAVDAAVGNLADESELSVYEIAAFVFMGTIKDFFTLPEDDRFERLDRFGCDIESEVWDMEILKQWNKMFCDRDPESACCAVEKKILDNYESVLKLGKYNEQATGLYPDEAGELEDLEMARGLLPFPVSTKARINSNPFLPWCRFGVEPRDFFAGCPHFFKSYSADGIAFTFNPAPFRDVYSRSRYSDAFYDEIYRKADVSEEEEEPRKIQQSGALSSLDFYINHLNLEVGEPPVAGPRVVVHNPWYIPDLEEGLEVRPGFTYTITVTPSRTVTDDGALGMEPDRRSCLSYDADDHHLKIFGKYTQEGCLFECQVKTAADQCGCIPWDYPRPSDDDATPLCHHVGRLCFRQAITNTTGSLSECACPNACEITSYDSAVAVQPTDVDTICRDLRVFDYRILGTMPFYVNDFLTLRSMKEGSYTTEEVCRWAAADLSWVKVRVVSKFANEITRSRRVTFADQLASLGGIVGLFSGMSILSVVEIAYWLGRLASERMSRFCDKKVAASSDKKVVVVESAQ